MPIDNRLLTAIPVVTGDMIEPDRAQEGLRTSEIRDRRLFEPTRDGTFILNAVTPKPSENV
jgi:hypothetical protein